MADLTELERAARRPSKKRPSGCALALIPLWVVLGIALVWGWVDAGLATREAAQGKGAPGTVTLERREYHSYGRGSGAWDWHGTFRSDQGDVVRTVRVENLPGEGQEFVSGGGWEVGDPVRVQWTARTPDEVYLEHTNAYRYWWEGTIFGVVCFGAIGVIALLVHRHRRRYPNGKPVPPAPPPPPPPPPSKREVIAARQKALRDDLDGLHASLDQIKRDRAR